MNYVSGITVEDQISHMRDEILACRDYGHRWKEAPLHATNVKKTRVIEAERILVCERSGCVRTDIFVRDEYDELVKVSSGIKYPPGYLLEREDPEVPTGRFARNDARMTLMQRLVPNLTW